MSDKDREDYYRIKLEREAYNLTQADLVQKYVDLILENEKLQDKLEAIKDILKDIINDN